MRGWDGTAWKPARSFNGVWWNDLAYDKCYVASYGGAAGLVSSLPAGRSFTLIVKHNEHAGTYGRVGEPPGSATRLMFYGDSVNLRLRLIRAQTGGTAAAIEFVWAKVAGQTWSSAVYDGHTLKGVYNGVEHTSLAPIADYDPFMTSGDVNLRCETTYSLNSNPVAILVPGKLTQTQIDQVIADFESSRTTKTPPALLSPVAPVANLGPNGSITLALPETSPRTMFFTGSSNGASGTIRNANDAILDNRLGLANYDAYSRAVYIDRSGVEQYLDNPGRSWGMGAWWDGIHAGLYSQRDNLTKQAEASLTPMPWTVVNGSTGLRLMAYDQRLPDDRIASITHWLSWVER